MTHLDTSVLIDALTGPRRSATRLRELVDRGERTAISALVLYEWLRGSRSPSEIAHQQTLFPTEHAVPFSAAVAAIAADLYRAVPRACQREFDLAIAACALASGARLWTLNPADFHDVPGLELHAPER